MNTVFYDTVKLLAIAILPILCRWEVKNKNNSLPQGPLIVIANHISWFDTPLLGVCLPRPIAFMAKEEYFRSPFTRFIFSKLGGFPVQRGEIDRKSLRQAIQLLEKGGTLGIFPEGTRSRNAQLQPARSGAIFIALRNGTFILPVGIAGTEKIKERLKERAWLSRPKVVINIGEPFKLPKVEGRINREQLNMLTNLTMKRVAELLPESYRGVYKGED